MDKIVTIGLVSFVENKVSYLFSRNISTLVATDDSCISVFKDLKQFIIKEYKNDIKGKLLSYENYTVSITITIIDIKKNTVKFKNRRINPLNLKGLKC